MLEKSVRHAHLQKCGYGRYEWLKFLIGLEEIGDIIRDITRGLDLI